MPCPRLGRPGAGVTIAAVRYREMNWDQEKIAFLGFGGNLGDVRKAFRAARENLSRHPQLRVLRSSSLYSSPAVGGPAGQPDYLNAVVMIATSLAPRELLQVCQEQEQAAGRERKIRWDARTLDIDLLLYADLQIAEPELEVPHPRLHQRHFTLRPLLELDGDLRHPRLKLPLGDLLRQLPPCAEIRAVQRNW